MRIMWSIVLQGGSSACLTKTGGEWRHRLKRRRHRYGGLITDVVAAAWKGAATPPSFGGVDDEAATNGRATQTDLRLEKEK